MENVEDVKKMRCVRVLNYSYIITWMYNIMFLSKSIEHYNKMCELIECKLEINYIRSYKNPKMEYRI